MHCVEEEDHEEHFQRIRVIKKSKVPPITTTVKVQGKRLSMEIDTGASVSIISECTWRGLWSPQQLPLCPTEMKLTTYTGEAVAIRGEVQVDVETQEGEKGTLPLIVVSGDGPSLLSRNWLCQLKLDWQEIHHCRGIADTGLSQLLTDYTEVFKEELGEFKATKVKIHIDSRATQKFSGQEMSPILCGRILRKSCFGCRRPR